MNNTISPDRLRRNAFDQVQIGMSSDDVTRIMSAPDRQASNEKYLVFLYTINHEGKILPKENFTFSNGDKKLTVKFLDIYSDDPESSLDFWKSKYPEGDFSIKSKTTVTKDFITFSQYIKVNSNLTLSIEHDKVSQAAWE
jgi:hypothetical protein